MRIKLGWWRDLICNSLDWHFPGAQKWMGYNSFTSYCKYCGCYILRDGFGMWYRG
jgi:hypothetical protein